MSRSAAKSCILFVVVLVVHLAFASDDHQPSLKFVTIVHRHGDRNPVSTYANDPYKDRKWPGGLGALSPHGSVQLFTLGKYLRRRYSRLLPADGFYSNENMQIISSAEDRCVMSVESLLASFMAPAAKVNPLEIAWQPVAITTIPADRDNILFQVASACPKYDIIFRKLLNNPDPGTDIYNFNQQNADLLKYINKHSGENITNIFQSVLLYDTLQVHNYHKLKLPEWTDSIFPDKMAPLKARAFELFTETPYMMRIKGGLLITEIVDKMIKKQAGELMQNIFIYSGHDATIANMVRGLNVTDQTQILPDYGASLFFELHCDDAYSPPYSRCIVKIWFCSNTDDKNPLQISIPNCPHPCSLEDFQNSIKDISIHLSEYAEACKLD